MVSFKQDIPSDNRIQNAELEPSNILAVLFSDIEADSRDTIDNSAPTAAAMPCCFICDRSGFLQPGFRNSLKTGETIGQIHPQSQDEAGAVICLVVAQPTGASQQGCFGETGLLPQLARLLVTVIQHKFALKQTNRNMTLLKST